MCVVKILVKIYIHYLSLGFLPLTSITRETKGLFLSCALTIIRMVFNVYALHLHTVIAWSLSLSLFTAV